jgi:hypothetical protein
MKTLNFEIVENYVLTNDEMLVIRGGEGSEGDPQPLPPTPPIKI